MSEKTRFIAFIAVALILIIASSVLFTFGYLPAMAMWAVIFAAVAVFLIPFFMIKGSDVTLGDDSFTVKALFVDVTIPYSSVESVECRPDIDFGTCSVGSHGIRRWSGTFVNSEFGEYQLAADTALGQYAVVRYDGGRAVGHRAHLRRQRPLHRHR